MWARVVAQQHCRLATRRTALCSAQQRQQVYFCSTASASTSTSTESTPSAPSTESTPSAPSTESTPSAPSAPTSSGGLHASDAIAFKPTEGGWGYSPTYKNKFSQIFGNKKAALKKDGDHGARIVELEAELAGLLARTAECRAALDGLKEN